MPAIYVNEYQPSCAKCMIGNDPFYGASQKAERLRIRRIVVPSPLIGIIVIFGILYFLTRR